MTFAYCIEHAQLTCDSERQGSKQGGLVTWKTPGCTAKIPAFTLVQARARDLCLIKQPTFGIRHRKNVGTEMEREGMSKLLKEIATFLLALSVAGFLVQSAAAENNDESSIQKRIQTSTAVLEEIMKTPDKGIPDRIMESAKCVVVIPSMVKIAIGFGGSHGKGVATCRTPHGWSAPAPVTLTGGSWGLQFGGEAVDVVMMIMSQRGADDLLSSKFKIGAGASAAAGPVGRAGQASTNYKFQAEILTYSRARGVFAGIDLSGSVIEQDKDETQLLYGKMVPFRVILEGKIRSPHGATPFEEAVARYARQAKERTEKG